MKRIGWPLIVVLGLGLSFLACDDTWRGLKKDTEENAEAAKRMTDRDNGTDRRDGAPDTESDFDKAVGKAKAKTEEIGKEITEETRAAAIHLDIKQALILDDTIDAAHINVDVDDEGRTVLLKGSVPTLEQKSAAERVARERSRGFSVRNELTVTSGH